MPPRRFAARRMALTLSMLCSWCSAACRTCPTCPPPVTLEAARPPAQITVTPDKTPCNLPQWPAPPILGGVPQGDNVLLTKDGLAELARYASGVNARKQAEKACEAKP